MITFNEVNYYTVKEAAKIIEVHPITLTRYCKQDDITARKIGNKWLIAEDALTAFLKGEPAKRKAAN